MDISEDLITALLDKNLRELVSHINTFVNDTTDMIQTHATSYPSEEKALAGVATEFWKSVDSSFLEVKNFLAGLSIEANLDDLRYVSKDLNNSLNELSSDDIYSYGDMRSATLYVLEMFSKFANELKSKWGFM